MSVAQAAVVLFVTWLCCCVDPVFALDRYVTGIGAFGPDQVWTRNEIAVAKYACQSASDRFLAPSGDRMLCRYLDDNYETIANALTSSIQAVNACKNQNNTADVVLGTVFSSSSVPVALVTGAFGIPMISWQATSDVLSDKDIYPLFSRVVPPDSLQGSALAHLLFGIGFERIGVIATDESYGRGLASSLSAESRKLGLHIVASQTIDPSVPVSDLDAVLTVFRNDDIRVIVLLANFDPARAILTGAEQAGMTGDDYLWVGTDGSMPSAPFPLGSIGTNLYSNLTSPHFQGLVNTLHALPNTTWNSDYDVNGLEAALFDVHEAAARALNHSNHVVRACQQHAAETVPFCRLFDDICARRNDTATCSRLSDVCMSWSSSQQLCEQALDTAGYRLIVNDVIRHVRFDGTSGLVDIDALGNNVGYYSVINQLQAIPYALTQNTTSFASIGVIDTTMQVTLRKSYLWPGASLLAPLDHRGLRAGQAVQSNRDGSIVILAVVVACIGSWVAMVLLEQALGALREHDTVASRLWSLATGSALAIAQWASLCLLQISITFPALPDTNKKVELDLGNFLGSLCVLLIGALACVHGSLAMLSHASLLSRKQQDVTDSASFSDMTASSMRLARAFEKDKSSRRDDRLYCGRLVTTQDMAVLLGFGTLWAQIVLCAFLLLQWKLHAPMSMSHDSGIIVGAAIAGVPPSVVGFTLFFYLNRTQWRFVSSLIMALTTLVVAPLIQAGSSFAYLGDSSALSLAAARISIDFDRVYLVAVVFFGTASICGIVLNSTKLRASREAMNTYAAHMARKLNKTEQRVQQGQSQLQLQGLLGRLLSSITPPVPHYQTRTSLLARTWQQRDVSIKFKHVSRTDITLQHVLDSWLAFPVLKFVATERKTNENILFLVAAREFALEKDGLTRLHRAHEIRDTFFYKKPVAASGGAGAGHKAREGFDFGEDDLQPGAGGSGGLLGMELKFAVAINVDAKLFDKQVAAINALRQDCPETLFRDSYQEVLSLVNNNEWRNAIRTSDLLELCIMCINTERYLHAHAKRTASSPIGGQSGQDSDDNSIQLDVQVLRDTEGEAVAAMSSARSAPSAPELGQVYEGKFV